MKILVLNSGSSSQKSCLYEIGDSLPETPPRCLWAGKIEWNGDSAQASIQDSNGHGRKQTLKISSRRNAIDQLLSTLWGKSDGPLSSPSEIGMVGHRVVHGGPQYEEPVVITDAVKSAIAKVAAFAPLHNRAELEGMEIVETLLGRVPQVAVFDTGFHRKMPLAASVYPGPYKWYAAGIRRYGFHGINHQYCVHRAAQMLRRELKSLRIISCHLGNGCSLAAVRDGRSIDTTMGFTPLEGLMMGTRSGSVDPGILTYLLRQERLTGDQLDDILNKQSGLLGVSGESGDMRDILSALRKGNERAQLAFDIYVHRLRAGIGAMAGVLGGLDVLIFTAGIGENSPEVRAATCENLAFLNLQLDPQLNNHADPDQDIAATNSAVRVLVIRAQEDWAIAQQCWKLATQSADKVSQRT